MSDAQEVPLPSKRDQRWSELVTQGPSKPVRLLALKFMLTRLTQDAKGNPSPEMTARYVDEIYEFFAKNPRMVEADVANLFG